MINNILIVLAIVTIINILIVTPTGLVDYEIDCVNNSGKWIKEYNECEYIGEKWCKERHGSFEECASACRHSPKSEMCITVCVPVCKIKD